MPITKEELINQKLTLYILLILTAIVLLFSQLRIKEQKKEIHRLKADYIILLENCKNNEATN